MCWACAQGFSSVYRPQRARAGAVLFAELLERVAEAVPDMRVRMTSPHPKDFDDDVLRASPRCRQPVTQLCCHVMSGERCWCCCHR